jgi:hypothetical protein
LVNQANIACDQYKPRFDLSMETWVKRTILAAAFLLAGVFGAQADVDGWTPMAKHVDLWAATNACDQQVGQNMNDVPTSAQYKRCMARHGWRYAYTRREPTWIDPETGLRCRNTGFATVCS